MVRRKCKKQWKLVSLPKNNSRVVENFLRPGNRRLENRCSDHCFGNSVGVTGGIPHRGTSSMENRGQYVVEAFAAISYFLAAYARALSQPRLIGGRSESWCPAAALPDLCMFFTSQDDDAQQTHRQHRGHQTNHGNCVHYSLLFRRVDPPT